MAHTLQFREKRGGGGSLPFPEPHKFPRVSHIHFKCLWMEFKVFHGILITYPSSLSLRSFSGISLILALHSDMPTKTLKCF